MDNFASNTDTTNPGNDQRNKKPHKSLAVFLCQIVLIYIVVLTSIINLSILDCTKPGVCNLWMVLLSSCLGILLPNPSLCLPGREGTRGGGGSNDSMLNFGGGGMGFTTVDGGALPNEPENRRSRKERDEEEEEEREEAVEEEEEEATGPSLVRSAFNFQVEPRLPLRFGGSSLSLASNAHSTYGEAGSLYNHGN